MTSSKIVQNINFDDRIKFLGASCLFAAYLLQFHQDITDRVALSLGMISRPVYIVNSKSHAAMIALRYPQNTVLFKFSTEF